MKPPDEAKEKIVNDWLRKAETDLELAEHLISQGDTFLNAAAFHSQQSAEKYLKAYLSSNQKVFPKTHDLDQLLDLVESLDKDLADSLRDVIVLTPYGVELRYPGDRPDANLGEAKEALVLAKKAQKAIKEQL